VLDWGRVNLRDLPWRATREPWAVLVSEVMAQQTQIERVVPKWEAFLAAWPDPAACAAAELSEVLLVWSGLGYPRRARDLHASATVIVERHDGVVPDDRDALLALPGVGPYTAAAVMAFAYEADVAVVDTNVARVLARVVGHRLGPAEVRRLAAELVPAGQGWWWNQTLMELGAICCRPRSPQCRAYPLAPDCTWRAAGNPDPDPAVGSALVGGGQGRFDGSNRQVRGRVMAALVDGPIPVGDLAGRLGIDEMRTRQVVDSLVDDRLVTVTAGSIRLGS
jgi:A/G-specific adenine glycosylase